MFTVVSRFSNFSPTGPVIIFKTCKIVFRNEDLPHPGGPITAISAVSIGFSVLHSSGSEHIILFLIIAVLFCINKT
jgi:hypothetical protein